MLEKFNCLPEQRIECVDKAFEDAPYIIKKIVNEYNNGYTVKNTRTLISNGRLVKESSYYFENDNTIYMNDDMDNDLYADVFRHEYGHYIDSKLMRVSLSENFKYAVQADRAWYNVSTDEGNIFLNEMLDDLSQSDAIYSAYVSDILSAIFYNDTKIRKMYAQNGVAYAHHDTDYWFGEGDNTPPSAVEREVFANLFAIYSENSNVNTQFMQKWFPNISARFQAEIEKRVNNE